MPNLIFSQIYATPKVLALNLNLLLRIYLSYYPYMFRLFFITLYRIVGKSKTLHCYPNLNTRLIIEGYPRSGNTYLSALLTICTDIEEHQISSHIHHIYSLKVCPNIPTLILIRNPIDAISSLCIREPLLSPLLLNLYYKHFYSYLLKNKKNVFFIDFKKITSDQSYAESLIKCLNLKYEFKSNYLERVNQKIIEMDISDSGNTQYNVLRGSIPSSQKEMKKLKVKKTVMKYSEKYHLPNLYDLVLQETSPVKWSQVKL